MSRRELTPFLVFSEKCIMLCMQHLVSVQETLKLSAPAVGGHLKRVQKYSLVLCIFEVYKIRAKWNLTRL